MPVFDEQGIDYQIELLLKSAIIEVHKTRNEELDESSPLFEQVKSCPDDIKIRWMEKMMHEYPEIDWMSEVEKWN